MGLDAKQFVLFLELFRTLSMREEFMGIIGVNRFNITYLAYWAAWMELYIVTFLLMKRAVPPAPVYLLISLSMTFAVTFLVFMREAANSLFNPVEASMLAHAPIHSPTYAAAKIVHLFIAVLYLVFGINLCPALLGIVSSGSRWFWPATHLASAMLVGLWTAFMICAFYGLIRRVLPADQIKRISKWIQILSMCAFVAVPFIFKSFGADLFTAKFENSQWTWLPLTWFVEIGRMGCHGTIWSLGARGAWAIGASVVIIWFGLRSFSGTYLSEAASSVVGQSRRIIKRNMIHQRLAALASAALGGPEGLGAFCFVIQMISRDKLFWRSVLIQTWIVLLAIIVVIASIARLGIYPTVHFFPHLLGLLLLALCINLPTTVFSNASWIYLTAPIGSVRAFSRGILGSLWVTMVALPHTAFFLCIALLAPWKDAVFIAGFNLIIASTYFAFATIKISGLPFSSPVNESKTMVNSIYIQICGLVLLALPISGQVNLWESPRFAASVAIALFLTIWFVLRKNLHRLEKEIRWRLYLLKAGSHDMFHQFD
jgi:hypothetical protein